MCTGLMMYICTGSMSLYYQLFTGRTVCVLLLYHCIWCLVNIYANNNRSGLTNQRYRYKREGSNHHYRLIASSYFNYKYFLSLDLVR
jgi:hypothetical protein